MRPWTFGSAGQLIFGRDSVREIAHELQKFKAQRVFLVTDANLGRAGVTDRVLEAMKPSGVSVSLFDRVTPEPGIGLVRECIVQAKAARPCVVIGLGGGSNMDTAKLAALILTHGGDPFDFVGELRVPGPLMPMICIPTTAGTGSEVSIAAVFTDTDNHMKLSCGSPYLRPAVAIVDSMLTVGCPARVTADSGIDALTHAIEAYTAEHNDAFPLPSGERSMYQGKNPLADAMASECITLVGKYLRRAVRDGSDLEARDGMALAATLGGLAFSNAGVALVHAMEYPVGGAVHVSHGAGNGLLLPYVMRYNLSLRVREFASIAGFLGASDVNAPEDVNANRAVEAVERLKADIGIPSRLRDLGVKETMLPNFAERAFAIKRLMRVNPRHPQSASELLEIYQAAF